MKHNQQSTQLNNAASQSLRGSGGRRKFFTTRNVSYSLIIFWALLGAVATVLNPLELQALEQQVQNLFYVVRRRETPPPNIVILAIDDESRAQGAFYQDRPQQYPYLEPIQEWPWKRAAYAQVIERVMGAGARSVSVDVILTDPSRYGPEDDQQLQRVLQKYAGRVTLAVQYIEANTPLGQSVQLEPANPNLITNSLSVGYINYLPGLNGSFVSLASNFREQRLEPAGLSGSLSFAEATLKASKVTYPSPKGSGIFFYGPSRTFPTIPFWYVLDPQNWKNYLHEGRDFKDKIVLIGPTANDSGDFQPTPVDTRMPGIEIHANSIATLQHNRAVAEVLPNSLHRGIVTFLGVATIGLSLSLLVKRTVARSVLTLSSAIAWGSISCITFLTAQLILPTAVPVLTIALGGLSSLGIGAIGDQFEKLRFRQTLERYVSAAIVREILDQPADYEALLQGRKIKATVLFCDIRGFTTLSFTLPPEQLIAQLNTYLSAMVAVIIEAQGTIDKFIGDAVMAEFGSPVSRGEKVDALNAIKAALGMRQALAELRERWQQQGLTLFFNGIGMNFGEVIAGNIGSLQRLEYTVIGDVVNVASRVEGLNKDLGTDILITKSLYDLVQDEVEAIDLGLHPLKGRADSVQLYSLIGLKGDDKTLYYEVQQQLRQSQADTRLALNLPAQKYASDHHMKPEEVA